MVMTVNPNGKGLVGYSNSQVDTAAIISKIVEIDSRRAQPVQASIDETQLEGTTWTKVKELMETVRAKADPLSKFKTWELKKVTSSDPTVATAEAGRKAEVGKTNIAVDKIALNHQIASSIIPSKTADIGAGKVKIRIGSKEFQEIEIGPEPNNAQQLVEKINEAKLGVEAAIVQIDDTGERFQIVLTSSEKGWKNRMEVEMQLQNGEHYPDFRNFHTQPDKWIYNNREIKPPEEINDLSSSTSIPQFSGKYTGEEDLQIRFTPINSGTIGAENQLRVKWEDNLGRSGELELGSFAYSAGTAINVVDGINVSFSKGTIVYGEFFDVAAKPDESGKWFVPDEEEPSKIYKPNGWRKDERGMTPPTISGKYVGDDDEFTFVVTKPGVVGKSDSVIVEYTSDEGRSGKFLLGTGYKPGTNLKLGDSGLEVSFPEGILLEGATSTFEAEEEVSGIFWWLNNGFDEDSTFSPPTHWTFPEGVDDKLGLDPDREKDRTEKRSNIMPEIVGYYTGTKNKEYTFKVEGNGTVGASDFLKIKWEDNLGGSGRLDVGRTYSPGDKLEFDEGLSIRFPVGEIYDGDFLESKAFSTVIQPPQDAVIRVNATSEGGGLEMRSGNNIFEEAIKGIKLEVIKSSPDIVTIDVQNDLEAPKATIREFVTSYNELLTFLQEASKYDPETGEAGPLQGESAVKFMQDTLSNIIINPVAGLDRQSNNSTFAGLQYNKEGKLDFDEAKFDTKAGEDIKKVGNIFSTSGHINFAGVEMIDATDVTQVTGGEVDFDVTQMPTKGYWISAPLGDFVRIDDTNNSYKIAIDGKESETIQLPPDVYTREQFVDLLERYIKQDKKIGEAKYDIILKDDTITIESHSYGSKSNVEFTFMQEIDDDEAAKFALIGGSSSAGSDAKAKIDNIDLDGSGTLLRGVAGTKFEGLRLVVFPDELKFNPNGPEGTFALTKGIAARAVKYSTEETQKKTTGIPKRVSDTNEQAKVYKEKLQRLNDTTDRKKERLVKQFSAMESSIAKIKQQELSMRGQLQGLGGGNKDS